MGSCNWADREDIAAQEIQDPVGLGYPTNDRPFYHRRTLLPESEIEQAQHWLQANSVLLGDLVQERDAQWDKIARVLYT